MFGPDARLVVNREPAPLPNEQSLIAELRAKLGPGPDQDKILLSIRNARGKTHWAVNSYLRDVMSAGCVPGEEDFHPRRAREQNGHVSTAEAVAAHDAIPQSLDFIDGNGSLEMLPGAVLELVLKNLDYTSLCAAAMSCKALAAAAASDALWSGLFTARWGAVVFPTEAYLAIGAGPIAGCGPTNGRTAPGMALAGLALSHPANLQRGPADGTAAAEDPGLNRASDGLRRCMLSRLGSGLAPVQENGPLASPQHPVALTRRSTVSASSHAGTLRKGSKGAGPTATGSAQVDPGVPEQQAATGGSSTGGARAGATGAPSAENIGTSKSARCRYRDQMAFLKSLRCPRCGSTALLPILYGFPSAKLLEGMRSKRLILGGDHLIESCHVWGCPNDRCGASYRFFPYDRVDEWMADQAKPQPAGPHYTYEL